MRVARWGLSRLSLRGMCLQRLGCTDWARVGSCSSCVKKLKIPPNYFVRNVVFDTSDTTQKAEILYIFSFRKPPLGPHKNTFIVRYGWRFIFFWQTIFVSTGVTSYSLSWHSKKNKSYEIVVSLKFIIVSFNLSSLTM